MEGRKEDAGGRLVLVATPIGNLDDLSPRAVRTLGEADVVAAEDTRHSGRLLARVGVRARLVSFHEHNETMRTPELVERVAAGGTVALVVDAGTPGIADPGFRLVRAAVARGLRVEAVPGPSALLHALVVSGLPTDRFAFEGFLPRRAGARREHVERIAGDDRTLVFYLSPHRAAAELVLMAEVFGAREAALCRELTKLHEEVWHGTLPALAERAASGVRGELALVVAGATPAAPEPVAAAEVAHRVRLHIADGMTKKDAIARVASASGLPKREVYQAVIDAGGEP